MVVVNEKLQAPDSPPLDWGITPRRHKVSDFSLFWMFGGITLLFVPGMVFPSLASITIWDGLLLWEMSMGLFIPFTLFSLIVVLHGLSQPAAEAARQAEHKANIWQAQVMKPFLEQRYGVKFPVGEDLANFFSWPKAFYKGKTISVEIRGFRSTRANFKFAPISHSAYIVEPDKIRLSEVIIPEDISYKTIPEL